MSNKLPYLTSGTHTIYFSLIDPAGEDLEVSASAVSGDSQISLDGAGFNSTANDFASIGNGVYSLVLTAAETQASDVIITVVDQSATKIWLDIALFYETYGHDSAKYAFDWSALNYLAALRTIHKGTVDTAIYSPLADQFEADSLINNDGTVTIPAAADHYKSRVVLFTSGTLIGQVAVITGYSKQGSNARFVVTSMSSAPANNDEFVIM